MQYSRFSRWLLALAFAILPLWSSAAISDTAVIDDNNDAVLDAACNPLLAQQTARLVRQLDRLSMDVQRLEAFGVTARAVRRAHRSAERFRNVVDTSCEASFVHSNFEILRGRMRELRMALQASELRNDSRVQQRSQRIQQTWRLIRQIVRAM